jgi:hypothetical protein
MNLQDAAAFVQGHKTPRSFRALVASIEDILDFPHERANRLARYIIITRAYEKGEAVQAIIDRFGCTRGTVLRYARMADLPKRPKHFAPEVRKAVLRDYRAKMPIAEIARLHEVSPAYVSKVAGEAGILRYAPRTAKSPAPGMTGRGA